jgi:hypothetical protein
VPRKFRVAVIAVAAVLAAGGAAGFAAASATQPVTVAGCLANGRITGVSVTSVPSCAASATPVQWAGQAALSASPSPTAASPSPSPAPTSTSPSPSPTGTSSPSCDLNATTSDLAAQFAAAQPGQTVCLASGNYGQFGGGAKTGMVTVEPQSGAAVSMSLNWNNVTFVTVTGVTVTSGFINGNSHDLAITHSTVSPGLIDLRTDAWNHANVLIDHDTFPGTLGNGGRIWVDFNNVNTANIIGLTISNNLFSGGDMTDIYIMAGAGTQIIGNEFTGLDNRINESIHADTIFNYGDHGFNVMRGNWFHDQKDVATCGWSEWDGGHDNVFEGNVISHAGGAAGADGCYQDIAVMDDSNSVIAHNVFQAGTGEAGPIGQVMLGGKTSEGAGSGTVIRDNVYVSVANGDGGLNATYLENHNLCSVACGDAYDQGTGAGDITGTPVFAGGSVPSTFAGFALAPGSPGIGGASDGSNIGIELPTGG